MSFPKVTRLCKINTSHKELFKKQGGKMTDWQHYLPPIFEEVFPKNILSGVLMVQHFCEEGGHFLCTRAEFHVFSW